MVSRKFNLDERGRKRGKQSVLLCQLHLYPHGTGWWVPAGVWVMSWLGQSPARTGLLDGSTPGRQHVRSQKLPGGCAGGSLLLPTRKKIITALLDVVNNPREIPQPSVSRTPVTRKHFPWICPLLHHPRSVPLAGNRRRFAPPWLTPAAACWFLCCDFSCLQFPLLDSNAHKKQRELFIDTRLDFSFGLWYFYRFC